MARLADSLRLTPLVWLLAASLLLFTAYGPVVFYVETSTPTAWAWKTPAGSLPSHRGRAGVRVFFGRAFDRYSKRRLLVLTLTILVLAYLFLVAARSENWLMMSALLLGLDLGAVMPLFNILIFGISPPAMRPLNTNLNMLMFQPACSWALCGRRLGG